jgi:hypothetical protein
MMMLWFHAAPPDDLQVGETGLHGLMAGCGLSPERICSLHYLASGWTALFDSAGTSSLGTPKKKARVRMKSSSLISPEEKSDAIKFRTSLTCAAVTVSPNSSAATDDTVSSPDWLLYRNPVLVLPSSTTAFR